MPKPQKTRPKKTMQKPGDTLVFNVRFPASVYRPFKSLIMDQGMTVKGALSMLMKKYVQENSGKK